MDFVTVRIVWTVLTFAVFVAILAWACSGRARRGFDVAARLPFDEGGSAADDRHASGGIAR
jgi:cytochrome c oxidase cbb3-type subunit 4